MKKRIVLGDMHGNFKTIEDIYNKECPDDVIILGDYCDSFVHETPEIVTAYKKLRKLQRNHKKGMFVTLMGNHDWHYISAGERYSGYKQGTWNAMHDILESDFNDGLLPIVYINSINKTVYAHAGVTKTWLDEWSIPELQDINECNTNALDFQFKTFDMYGDSKWQGPLWVRPEALLSDFYGDGEWKQIVGHTRTRNGKPLLVKMPGYKNTWSDPDEAWLYVIDTLPFMYVREMLDDDRKLVCREIVDNVKFNGQLSIQ